MPYFYVDSDAETDQFKLPDVEIWYTQENYKQRGFFYAYGFPGCLHDSEPVGPFNTEQEALTDAREGHTDG